MKYTKGNWEQNRAATYQDGKVVDTEYFVMLEDDDVAIASDIVNPATCEVDKVALANARLIAAAPDLYEAARWVLHVMNGVGMAGGEPEAGEHDAAFGALLAAVNKAEESD
jgi:hypothetical protein